MILENIESEQNVVSVTSKIRHSFEQDFNINSIKFNIQVSIGSAIYPSDATTEEELLNLADKDMYKDKHKQKK